MKSLYKYTQSEFPYARLVEENKSRGRDQPEFELEDAGVFDHGRYFDVVAEYAKATPDDTLIKITVTNHAPEAADILARYAPIIEPRGYGHAFLDLTGTGRLFGVPLDVAWRIQREAGERLRLPLAVGIAQNKLVSEAASVVVKEEGGGTREPLLQILAGTEAPFLAPCTVTLLPDLTPKIQTRLDDYQLERIGELQVIPVEALVSVFGRVGSGLATYAQGIDPRPVLPPAVKAEFRAVHTLSDDTNDLRTLSAVLRQLTERLGSRLRARGLIARRLTVHLAYTDYATARRQVAIPAGALDADLWEAARRGFTLAQTRTVAIRALGVVADQFAEAECQMDLFGEETVPGARRKEVGAECETKGAAREAQGADRPATRHQATDLQRAIDRIRTRWGKVGVRVGR